MKIFKTVLVISVLLVICFFNVTYVSSEKPVDSPRFQKGTMGEIFEGLAVAGGGGGQAVITSDELVGEWTCDAFASYSTNSLVDDDWMVGPEDLFLRLLGGSITFNDDGDGSYSITHTGQDPFSVITTDETQEPSYIVVGDTIYRKSFVSVGGQTYPFTVSFNIKRITQNIIIFKYLDGSQFAARVVVCQRVLN